MVAAAARFLHSGVIGQRMVGLKRGGERKREKRERERERERGVGWRRVDPVSAAPSSSEIGPSLRTCSDWISVRMIQDTPVHGEELLPSGQGAG